MAQMGLSNSKSGDWKTVSMGVTNDKCTNYNELLDMHAFVCSQHLPIVCIHQMAANMSLHSNI